VETGPAGRLTIGNTGVTLPENGPFEDYVLTGAVSPFLLASGSMTFIIGCQKDTRKTNVAVFAQIPLVAVEGTAAVPGDDIRQKETERAKPGAIGSASKIRKHQS
jgi:hypothetical protein